MEQSKLVRANSSKSVTCVVIEKSRLVRKMYSLRPMWRNGRRNGLKIAVLAISEFCAAYQIQRDLPRQNDKIGDFRCLPEEPSRNSVIFAQLLYTDVKDRRQLYVMQTPQIFERDLLEEAYHVVYAEKVHVTDAVSAVEHIGRKVALVLNEQFNFKITQPRDLSLAEFILQGARPLDCNPRSLP
jgi:2-C-methyl-D-erythritol 4-phosphate cytidylyltransferase